MLNVMYMLMLSEIFGHITYPTYMPILAVCIYMCTMHCTLISLVFFPGVCNTDLILQNLFTLNLTHTHLKKTSAVIVQSLYRLNNAPQTALSLGFPLTWLPLCWVIDCLTPSSLCLSLLLFTLPKRFRATLNIFTSRLLWKVASPLQICHSAFTAYYVLYVARRCCDVWHALPLLIDPREKEREKDDLRKRKTLILQALSKMM